MIQIIHPKEHHFDEIQKLCKRVYPYSKPWSIAQLQTHQIVFPEGQFIAVESSTKRVVGLAFSLIVRWSDYLSQDSWQDFTSAGYFKNHNAKTGKTLYGAEVMVDPVFQGQGIGKKLYHARRNLALSLKLKRIRAGARLRGYSKFKDVLSPQEYAKQVIEGKIHDPTLSFQLKQGFVVLDVAQNYLLNDPESMGYAAVIEWLNPEYSTPFIRKKQRARADYFLSSNRVSVEYLPRELRTLVRKATHILGETIRNSENYEFYHKIEQYRLLLKTSRKTSSRDFLEQLFDQLNHESPEHRMKIAHAFGVLLELTNACEAAYRTWRHRQKRMHPIASTLNVTFVLTAHPTEARSAFAIDKIQRLISCLVQVLDSPTTTDSSEIESIVYQLWNCSLWKNRTPTVLNEAEYVASIVLHNHILDFIGVSRTRYQLKFRTWVGGDKDGHTGVDEHVMIQCMQRSRHWLIRYISWQLEMLIKDVLHMKHGKTRHLLDALANLKKQVSNLTKIVSSDGRQVAKWTRSFSNMVEKSPKWLQHHFALKRLQVVLEMFPALVISLELRENSDLISKAPPNDSPLRKMIQTLRRISKGLDPRFYVRGLVVSHTESYQDWQNASALIRDIFGTNAIPVVPLFESLEALKNGPAILEAHLSKPKMSTVEVMVGYSDSAKELGALASRHAIRKSILEMQKTAQKYSAKLIIFHGSGGSVSRGGGSIREQVASWPGCALQHPKLTIQGEMIQRTFSSPELLDAFASHFVEEILLRKNKEPKSYPECLDSFCAKASHYYKQALGDSRFLSTLLKAGPFDFLTQVNIGSRPTRRPGTSTNFESLRAIPWVLCFTQTRLLFPVWWGLGSAWHSLGASEKLKLKEAARTDALFSSFLKTLGFTCAKVRIEVWKLYVLKLCPERAEYTITKIEEEWRLVCQFYLEITGSPVWISEKPWLEESIQLRSPYIHVLSALQVIAMKDKNPILMRETFLGIASGMLTTG